MNNVKKLLILIKDVFLNFFSGAKIVLITEFANWSIYEDCLNIKNNLKKINIRISTTPIGLRNKIVHFVSVHTLLNKNGLRYNPKSNKFILTWYHIADTESEITNYATLINENLEFIQTSSTLTREKLIKIGINPDKIVVIPLGVDLEIFHPVSLEEKKNLRKIFDLPENKIIIGSFQKDGDGWGKGMTPKLIKGPDIFCDVIENLSFNRDIHVMLTGPSRGFVKESLKKIGISYSHVYLKNYKDLARYYSILDLYIISSREEGGPKALLESMASGIPLVSTRVGMVPDIIINGANGFEVPIDDKNAIISAAEKLLEDEYTRNIFIINGIETSRRFSIKDTTRMYYDFMYRILLNEDKY